MRGLTDNGSNFKVNFFTQSGQDNRRISKKRFIVNKDDTSTFSEKASLLDKARQIVSKSAMSNKAPGA